MPKQEVGESGYQAKTGSGYINYLGQNRKQQKSGLLFYRETVKQEVSRLLTIPKQEVGQCFLN